MMGGGFMFKKRRPIWAADFDTPTTLQFTDLRVINVMIKIYDRFRFAQRSAHFWLSL